MTGKKKEEKKKCKYALEYETYKCSRPALPGDEHCIFHSKDIEGKKNKFDDAFWKEFKRQKALENEYDFTGFVFPREISFNKIEFDKKASFELAKFGDTKFSVRADFKGAKFSKEAEFGGAKFYGDADFSEAQFYGKTDFTHAEFPRGADFKDVKFSVRAYFDDAKFSKAEFEKALFFCETYFWRTQFSGVANFTASQFSRVAFFGGAKFIWDADFRLAQFSGDAGFESAEFIWNADFRNAQFSGWAYFAHTKFSRADFGGAQFSGADFRSAKFSWKGDFNGAQFSGRAYFNRAEFYAEIDNIDGAIDGSVTPVTLIPLKGNIKKYWGGMRIIVGTNDNSGNGFEIIAIDEATKTLTISPGVNDVQANGAVVKDLFPVFDSTSNFSHTKFSKFADFGEAQFDGEVHFTGAEFFENASFNSFRYSGKVNFREVKFYKRFEFQRTCYKDEDVNNLSFEYTDIFNEKGLFDFIKYNKEKFNYSKKTKLEFLPDNFKLILGEEVAARDPTTTRKVRDDMFLLKFKDEHPNWFRVWWLFADCGRSFFRWAMWSFVFAFLFGLIYTPCPGFAPDWWIDLCNKIGPQFIFTSENVSTQSPGLLSLLYFSIVTFTTLGFGDIVATNITARILVTVEVILGYIMLGGLISILANKLARRS